MFARKIKSVFDKHISRQANFKKTVSPYKKYSFLGDKILFKVYKNNMAFWGVGTTKQRIGELVYIVQGPKNTHKRHMNQLRKCRLNESQETSQNTSEEPIDTIFDHLDCRHAPSFSKSTTLGKKKKNFATARCKSQEADVLIAYFFCPFSKRKKKKLFERGVVRPKFTCIVGFSILLAL